MPAAAAVPISSATLDNVDSSESPYSKYSFFKTFGVNAIFAGPLNASAVEMINVVTISIHGCKSESRYPVATYATQAARIKSVDTIIAFLFLPSTQAPASGVIKIVGTRFIPNIIADHAALPVSS